jgi:hypothetical protein
MDGTPPSCPAQRTGLLLVAVMSSVDWKNKKKGMVVLPFYNESYLQVH